MSSVTWSARQPVPAGARWFSAGSCAVAAAVLLLILVSTWRDAPTAQSVLLLVLGLGSLVAAWLFLRSGAELHVREGAVTLKLYPIWSATFAAAEIAEISTTEVKPLPREWGWIGSPQGPTGRVVGVGNVRDAVQLRLVDGRRYALTLDPDDHDLPAVVEQVRAHVDPARSRRSGNP